MVQNPPAGSQRIVPFLVYEDAPAAIDFLCSVFGFEPGQRFDMGPGLVAHAEVHYGGETLMLTSAFKEMGSASVRNLPAYHAGVTMYVDDVDAHYAHSKAAGAEIVEDLSEQFYGDRVYRAFDSEGNRWDFHQHVRDVSEAAMMAAMGEQEG